jgi:hypothetical protein
MENLVAGVLLIVLGTAVAVFGTRLFYLLLPAWGFLVGFVLGAQLMTELFGEAFLATVAGWGVGIVLGVVLAIVAGVWFWAAIVILAGGLGWTLGTGLLAAIGMTDGVLPLVAGAVVAAAFAIVAIVIDAPTLLVAVLTSIGGAAYAVAGAIMVLGRIGPADLEHGPVGALAGQPVALTAWLVLAAVALGYQLLEARARSTDLRARLNRPTAA